MLYNLNNRSSLSHRSASANGASTGENNSMNAIRECPARWPYVHLTVWSSFQVFVQQKPFISNHRWDFKPPISPIKVEAELTRFHSIFWIARRVTRIHFLHRRRFRYCPRDVQRQSDSHPLWLISSCIPTTGLSEGVYCTCISGTNEASVQVNDSCTAMTGGVSLELA